MMSHTWDPMGTWAWWVTAHLNRVDSNPHYGHNSRPVLDYRGTQARGATSGTTLSLDFSSLSFSFFFFSIRELGDLKTMVDARCYGVVFDGREWAMGLGWKRVGFQLGSIVFEWF